MRSLYYAAGTAAYRGFGRIIAQALGRHEIVRGVFLHRSTATGEVQFGRSDIDMGIVIRVPRQPDCDGKELIQLYERVRKLRRINPAIGEIEVHDAEGLRSWIETDTYRGSMERRSLRWVYGEPVELPEIPVSIEDSARRAACWFNHFIPNALMGRNRRNMRKYALSFWDSLAVAAGEYPEPLLRRSEIEAKCAERGECPELFDGRATVEDYLRCVLELAKRLHDLLLPALDTLDETLILHKTPIGPQYWSRNLILVPRADSAPPPEAYDHRASVLTPEAFHLFLHFLHPFVWSETPNAVRGLGIIQPSQESYRRAAEFHVHSQSLRYFGFMNFTTPGGALATVEEMLDDLEQGRTPGAITAEKIQQRRHKQPTLEEYYLRDYPQLCAWQARLWKRLKLRQPAAVEV